MPVLQDNKSPIEKIVHEPKDNYMLKLYFFVSESEIHVLFNEVQPEVFKDCDFYPVELTPSRPYYTMLTISVCNNMQKAANCMFDMSHTTTCLVMLRKVEDSSTFCATYKPTFCSIAGCQNGVILLRLREP